VDRQQAVMATPQQDNRTTQEKSANSVLDASGLNDLDADMLDWNDSGDEPDAQRNLRDELDRAKTPTPTELVIWKKPYTDRDQAPRERELEEFDKIIEEGTAITLELYDEAPEREELAVFSLPQMNIADISTHWGDSTRTRTPALCSGAAGPTTIIVA